MINLYSRDYNIMYIRELIEMVICKGGCNKEAGFGYWCRPIPIHCPVFRNTFNERRIENISKTKKLQGKLGLNPMQNPEICKKNHSQERNLKASRTLKKLGELRLLPQQIESNFLKEKRRKNVSMSLRKMVREGIFPTQIESKENKMERFRKVSLKLKKLANEGKLPIQNATETQKRIWTNKRVTTWRSRFKQGLIKVYNSYGKRYSYYSPLVGSVNLRSGWEIETARLLDKFRIKWQYEPLFIEYWDTTRKKKAFTIPDFYLPDYKLFIEVKGSEFGLQKTLDKLKGIRDSGYKAVLLGRKEFKRIREGLLTLTNIIGGNNTKN